MVKKQNGFVKKIVIGPSTFAAVDNSPVDKLLENGFEVVKNPFGRKLTVEELVNLLPGAQGLIAGLESIDEYVLEHSKLKVISRCGAGVDNIDLKTAESKGIKVFSTPGAPTNAVAELTIGAMISLIRHIPQANEDVRNGLWPKRIGAQLEKSTIVIIGFGRIGRRVAELLKPFQVRIIAVDPAYKGDARGIEILPLREALPQADIVTIHASGDSPILNKSEFSIMKKGVYLLNCARGGLIDEELLIEALDSGRVAGAWLDCFKEEPYKGPLTKYFKAILTPHIGSYTARCRSKMEMESVDNLIDGFRRIKE